ncbi:acylphosphatase-2-like isoform X4 [Scyliorhinus canicula]|uniref:acylphosphatase-2-like isoform X4 n=1 Tax=Scyliorhinus canicula TaxID=7830 RepID=UPI0018F318EF|nr:acylphosphatase-2-like isoform X4 [Scyliorhinus canicula]
MRGPTLGAPLPSRTRTGRRRRRRAGSPKLLSYGKSWLQDIVTRLVSSCYPPVTCSLLRAHWKGVFFRKYTEEQARKLGLVGWVKNTSQGTVIGQVQGAVEKVNFMMNWLKSVGSPMSRIDRANFSNEREISKLDFDMFSTRY